MILNSLWLGSLEALNDALIIRRVRFTKFKKIILKLKIGVPTVYVYVGLFVSLLFSIDVQILRIFVVVFLVGILVFMNY